MSSKKLAPDVKVARRKVADRKARVTLVKARNLQPIIVSAIRRKTEVTILKPEELDLLKIDRDYQRPENRDMVNQLVAVLEAGGVVPDPITVAVRPNGDRYIVDGQQRWAAHYLAQKPLAAVLYFVVDQAEERRLFSILNTVKRPTSAIRMRAWTGASAELVQWLAAGTDSPLKDEVAFYAGRARWPMASVLRGLGAVLLGTVPRSLTEEFMRQLDRVYVADKARAKRVAQQYAVLIKHIWEQGRAQSLALVALGWAAATRWEGNGAIQQPTKAELYHLRRMNWTNVPIAQRQAWLPALKAEILRRWKA